MFGPFAERKCFRSKTLAPVVAEEGRFGLQPVPGLFSTPSVVLGILECKVILIHACKNICSSQYHQILLEVF